MEYCICCIVDHGCQIKGMFVVVFVVAVAAVVVAAAAGGAVVVAVAIVVAVATVVVAATVADVVVLFKTHGVLTRAVPLAEGSLLFFWAGAVEFCTIWNSHDTKTLRYSQDIAPAGAFPNTWSSSNDMRPLAMYVPEPGQESSVPINLFTAFTLTQPVRLVTSN
ncbi:hypothetical protein Tco_0660019 [Tanacetum coccineum]